MKKTLLFAIPLAALLLSGCGGNAPTSTTSTTTAGTTTGTTTGGTTTGTTTTGTSEVKPTHAGTQEDPYVAEDILIVMANYEPNQISTNEVYMTGKLIETTYDSAHTSWSGYMEGYGASSDTPVQIYSAQMGESITTPYSTTKGGLDGYTVCVKGHLKLYENTTTNKKVYEMAYDASVGSPEIYSLVEPSQLRISQTEVEIVVGDKPYQISYSGAQGTVTFTIKSGSDVITLNQDNTITGVKGGTGIVTVSDGVTSIDVTFTVKEDTTGRLPENPFTVAQAIALIDEAGKTTVDGTYYIRGIVTSIQTAFSPSYGNINVYISDDGVEGNNQFELYRLKGIDQALLLTGYDVEVGDTVVACCDQGLTYYAKNAVYENNQTCNIASITKKDASHRIWTNIDKVEGFVEDEVDITAVVGPTTGTVLGYTIEMESKDTSICTIDGNTVSLVGGGETTIEITASLDGGTPITKVLPVKAIGDTPVGKKGETKDNPFAPVDLIEAMKDYTSGQVSEKEYFLEGIVVNSTYNSKFGSWTAYFLGFEAKSNYPVQIYSAQLDEEITGIKAENGGLDGYKISAKGLLKLYESNGVKTYEMAYDSATDNSPVIYKVVDCRGTDKKLVVAAEELPTIMKDYTSGQVSEIPYFITGKLIESTYDSNYGSWTAYFEGHGAASATPIQLYSAKLDDTITGVTLEKGGLDGYKVSATGLLKLYEKNGVKTFEMAYDSKTKISPVIYEATAPVSGLVLDFADYSNAHASTKDLSVSDAKSCLQECCNTTDLIVSVEEATKVYGGEPDNKGKGIKFGTGSVDGVLTFTISKPVTKVDLVCYGWTTNDTIAINSCNPQTIGIDKSSANPVTLTFDFGAETTSISIKTARRAFIQTMILH